MSPHTAAALRAEPKRLTTRDVAKEVTRTKVLVAAKTCFSTLGYEVTTIRGIAHAAGMSTGAVFASFSGKVELYEAVYGHAPISPEAGRELLAALRGVMAVADRKTDEFDAARAAIAGNNILDAVTARA